jgi:FKBP-type peptidyl-prolyl cis-trans isomerase FklB
MTKRNLLSFCVLAAVVLFSGALNSCKESDEVSEYDNWQARNEHFIDSIASVAKTNRDGAWTILKAFTLSDDFPMTEASQYYIYVQKLEHGSGSERPLYADSVRVHYSGRLIPTASYPQGFVFDKSYASSSFNPATDVPSLHCVNQTVVGFGTALMNMVVGDRWKVYIPYQLGYGITTSTNSSVPAYSTLIFDMQLAKIYKYKVDTDTKWWSKRRF